MHDISECVDEIQKEKEQKRRDAVIKKTEVLKKRLSALNSKAGLVSHMHVSMDIIRKNGCQKPEL